MADVFSGTLNGAVLSDDKRYRYYLSRNLDDYNDKTCTFIMLNPSTADAVKDDPTIRRCKSYAEFWGCGKLMIVNLFAFRATNPKVLYDVLDPIGGAKNDEWILKCALHASRTGGPIVAAWGTHGSHRSRDWEILGMLEEKWSIKPKCLKQTKHGHPSHPLYLSKSLKPVDIK